MRQTDQRQHTEIGTQRPQPVQAKPISPVNRPQGREAKEQQEYSHGKCGMCRDQGSHTRRDSAGSNEPGQRSEITHNGNQQSQATIDRDRNDTFDTRQQFKMTAGLMQQGQGQHD